MLYDSILPLPVSNDETEETNFIPNPEGPELPPGISGFPERPRFPERFPLDPFPGFHLCSLNMKQGCYAIDFQPNGRRPFFLPITYFKGTLRVENAGSSKIISGDFYKFRRDIVASSRTTLAKRLLKDIPIYGRRSYYSYLKATSYSSPRFTKGNCKITIGFDEWVYNHPASTTAFNGTFNSSPTRSIKFVLEQGASSKEFVGKVYAGSTLLGSVTLRWVSSYFRKATVEIDTLTGAVSPQPLNPGTPTEESFTTAFATAGWKMSVIYNDTNVPVPAGVTSTACWSEANLHALMLAVRSSAVTLDTQWRFHMLAVPGAMGCSRGRMYDQIGAHREACVTYSHDGYPTSDSAHFGAAANQQQRNVPRAFIRSAAHELGHCCNMMHQELEGGADNSIMTTTPSVADTLGSATTGDPGVFPTDIHLGFNDHCRHHLIHFPDPVVRPGAMAWTAGHPSLGGLFVPEVDGDRYFFPADLMKFTLKTQGDRVKIGEPLLMAWEVENLSKQDIYLPNDIGVNIEYTTISVTDPDGKTVNMNNFVLQCEHSSISKLAPGKKLAAATNLFWSSNGFAFSTSGKSTISMCIRWTHEGVEYGITTSKDVWVDYPTDDTENEIAASMMDNEVGMFVALGGNAYHLKGAVARIEKVIKLDPKSAVAKAFGRFYSTNLARAYKPITLTRTPAKKTDTPVKKAGTPVKKAAKSAKRSKK